MVRGEQNKENDPYIGQKFNMLTCIEFSHHVYYIGDFYKFKCDCGKESIKLLTQVKNGYIKSCGCLRKINAKKSTFKDLTGLRFNYLLVLEYAGRKNGRTMWKCQCDCGNITYVDSNSLKSGNTKACGCHQSDGWGQCKTHGMTKTQLYRSWTAMRNRCYQKSNKYYCNYGGRGISVCDEWRYKFESFRDWAYDNGYKEGMTLDRIDNNGNYCPDNCKWSTRVEQMNNTRANHFLEFDGKRMTIAQWSKYLNVPYYIISNRICNYGWSVEDALTIPVLKRGESKSKYSQSGQDRSATHMS